MTSAVQPPPALSAFVDHLSARWRGDRVLLTIETTCDHPKRVVKDDGAGARLGRLLPQYRQVLASTCVLNKARWASTLRASCNVRMTPTRWMMTAEVWAVVVSIAAFVVSLYGIFEKRRDARRQLLVRLGTIIDELNKVNYDHDREVTDRASKGEQVPPGLGSIANSRREVLGFEAQRIGEELRDGPSPAQWRAIATNWVRASKPRLALDIFERLVKEQAKTIEGAYAARGLADALMQINELAKGRETYRVAVERFRNVSSIPHWDIGETYLRWAWQEMAVGDLTTATQLLSKAHQSGRESVDRWRRSRLERMVADTRKDLDGLMAAEASSRESI